MASHEDACVAPALEAVASPGLADMVVQAMRASEKSEVLQLAGCRLLAAAAGHPTGAKALNDANVAETLQTRAARSTWKLGVAAAAMRGLQGLKAAS